eukprot:1378832-Amphidinium_carterae.1
MVDVVDESLTSIRTEWKVLKQKWFIGETLDPVYEGILRSFTTLESTLRKEVVTGAPKNVLRDFAQIAPAKMTLIEKMYVCV